MSRRKIQGICWQWIALVRTGLAVDKNVHSAKPPLSFPCFFDALALLFPSLCTSVAVTECGLGEEEQVAPTSTSDRVCTPCTEGSTFKAVKGSGTKCQPVLNCDIGEEELRGMLFWYLVFARCREWP